MYTIKINGVLVDFMRDFSFNTGKNGVPNTLVFSIEDERRSIIPHKREDEVEFFDDSNNLFSGNITKIERRHLSKDVQMITYTTTDFSHEANKGELIAEIYKKMSVDDIISDIVTRYPQFAQFTMNNVNCEVIIDYLFLDHLRLYQVLTELASRTGFTFYIDNDKDIHFKNISVDNAPIIIKEDNGSFLYDSFKVVEDGSKIINNIIVEGATYDASQLTTEPNIIADGVQTEFNVLKQYAGVEVKIAGVSKTVGSNGVHNPLNYDCLYDFPGKKVIFRDDNKPTNGQVFSLFGFEKLPILTQVIDDISVGDDGMMSKKIKDLSLKTIDSAYQYAAIILERYAQEYVTGRFQTLQKGLRAGQRITSDHNLLGTEGSYYIQSTTSVFHSMDKMRTSVTFASAEEIDAASMLALLLNTNNRTTSNQQIINVLRRIAEKVGVSDEFTINEDVFDFEEETSVSDDFLVITNEVGRVPVHAGYEPTGLNDPKFPMLHNGSKAHI